MAEFGDELTRAARVRPVPSEEAPTPEDQRERMRELEQENAELREALNAPVHVVLDADLERTEDAQIAELSRQLEEARGQLVATRALADATIADLRREARGNEAQREGLKKELASARQALEGLQQELLERTRGSDLQVQLKQMALDATGNDSTFAPVLRELELSGELPLRVGRLLEDRLRWLLHRPESERDSLYDLIQQATDLEVLPRDAVDMAHLIRRQRNTIAHAAGYEPTFMVRSLLCLYAMALLWPELPRGQPWAEQGGLRES